MFVLLPINVHFIIYKNKGFDKMIFGLFEPRNIREFHSPN